MDKSTNLQLWLPEDSDPLEVSKLSENFEALDGALGSGTEAILKSMEIGDITYSTRNLEEESGGKLIACDGRTIDITAYPDVPKEGLYWPHAELMFSEPLPSNYLYITVNESVIQNQTSDANTDDMIYTWFDYTYFYNSGGTVTSSMNQFGIGAYSISEKKIYKKLKDTQNSNKAYSYLLRISEDKLLMLPQTTIGYGPAMCDNKLNDVTSTIPSGIKSALLPGKCGIIRVNDSTFFLAIYSEGATSEYPTGFYKTSDFATYTSIVAPTVGSDNAISYSRISNKIISSYCVSDSPFFPIRRVSGSEVYIVFGPTDFSVSVSGKTDEEIKSVIVKNLPTIWETTGGCSGINFRRAGEQGFADWLVSEKKKDSGNSQVTFACSFFVDGKYILFIKFGKASSTAGEANYIVCLDLFTEEFHVIGGLSLSALPKNADIFGKYTFYNQERIYSITKGVKYVIDLKSYSLSGSSVFDYPVSTKNVSSTPSFTEVVYDYCLDRDYKENVLAIRTESASSILSSDLGNLSDVSGLIRADGLTTKTGVISNSDTNFLTSPKMATPQNITEFDGDLYLGQAFDLYRIPLKTKRQMPYIENGYMKVLDEEASE